MQYPVRDLSFKTGVNYQMVGTVSHWSRGEDILGASVYLWFAFAGGSGDCFWRMAALVGLFVVYMSFLPFRLQEFLGCLVI